MKEPRYLSITISATCDNCGAETDDAEGTWSRINESTICPDCKRTFGEIELALANVFAAIQISKNPDVTETLGAAARFLQKAQREMVH